MWLIQVVDGELGQRAHWAQVDVAMTKHRHVLRAHRNIGLGNAAGHAQHARGRGSPWQGLWVDPYLVEAPARQVVAAHARGDAHVDNGAYVRTERVASRVAGFHDTLLLRHCQAVGAVDALNLRAAFVQSTHPLTRVLEHGGDQFVGSQVVRLGHTWLTAAQQIQRLDCTLQR